MSVPQLTGPIVALERVREVNHRDDVLPLWEHCAKAALPSLPWSGADKMTPDDLFAAARGAKRVIVACTERCPDVLRQFIERAPAQSAARLYLYAPTSWQDDPSLKALLARRPNRLLIRLGVEPPGDWIVAEGTGGRLFVGPPGQRRRWTLTLDAGSSRSLFQAFAWLFWHRATLEAIPGTPAPGLQRCMPAPWPDPVKAKGDPLLLACGTLLPEGGALPLLDHPELVVSPDGARWPGDPSRILTSCERTDFALLLEHSRRGASLVWSDLGLPRLALTRHRLALALEDGPTRLQIELKEADAIATMHALEEVERRPSFRFYAARRLADVQDSVWLKSAAALTQVQDRVELKMGTLPAPQLDAMITLEPSSWHEPPGPARSWGYTWRVTPPRAPDGAREARLVQAWRKVDEYVTAQVEVLRRQLKAMEDEEASSGLLTRLAGLVKPWDRVKRQRRQLSEALDEISEDRISRRPAEASDILKRLEDQHEMVKRLRREARDAEENEERRLDEERQRAEHERRRTEMRRQIEDLSGQLTELQTKRIALKEREDRADAELLDREHLWRETIEVERAKRKPSLEKRQRELNVELDRLNEERKQIVERSRSASQRERKALSKEQSEKSTEMNRIRGQLGALAAEMSAEGAPPEDLKALRDGREALRKERKELDDKEGALQRRLDAAHGEHNRPLELKPTVCPSRPLVIDDLPPRPTLPSDHPPAVGRLVEHGGALFLEVSTWEEASQARPAAERLKATLVAKAT